MAGSLPRRPIRPRYDYACHYRHTAEPAALYAVLINRNPGILYETAEPLSAKRAVHAKVSPDAPIAELALEARYRT